MCACGSTFAFFVDVPASGLPRVLRCAFAQAADDQSDVSVLLLRALPHDRDRPRLDDRDAHDRAVVGEVLGAAKLPTVDSGVRVHVSSVAPWDLVGGRCVHCPYGVPMRESSWSEGPRETISRHREPNKPSLRERGRGVYGSEAPGQQALAESVSCPRSSRLASLALVALALPARAFAATPDESKRAEARVRGGLSPVRGGADGDGLRRVPGQLPARPAARNAPEPGRLSREECPARRGLARVQPRSS